MDRGEPGESYILGGEVSTLGEVLDKVASMSGHKPARMTVPPAVVKAMAPLAPAIGSAMGMPPNLREAIEATHNVTLWFKDDKARAELGYQPRDLDAGLRAMLAEAANTD
jgi:dihydroflavonol-4-reductase